jgi:glycine hydroxymethyltransferase
MESSTDSKKSFFKHVFNFDNDSKSDIINIIQYALIAIIPIVILNKSMQKFVPEADEKKGSVEVLAEVLIKRGLKITTGGTDFHLMVVDLTPLETLTGKEAEKVLERAGLTCNKNAIPNDPRSPFVTSGLRFGTAAGTTRGFKEKEFEKIGNMIADVLSGFVKDGEEGNKTLEEKVKSEVATLCKEFPIY